jgi:hypothetical protein
MAAGVACRGVVHETANLHAIIASLIAPLVRTFSPRRACWKTSRLRIHLRLFGYVVKACTSVYREAARIIMTSWSKTALPSQLSRFDHGIVASRRIVFSSEGLRGG